MATLKTYGKLGKITFWLVVVYFASRCLNYLLHHRNVQGNSQWLSETQHESSHYTIFNGCFNSQIINYVGFPFVRGYITTILPEPIPRDTDFKIRILVHYDILGIMRPGGVNTFEVIGHLSSESNESYGGDSNCSDAGVCNVANNVNIELSSSIFKFGFKMKGMINNRPIEYQAMVGRHDSFIIGTYSYLNDYGYFQLNRVQTKIQKTEIQNLLQRFS